MIYHFANQSQACQLLKNLKNIFFSNIKKKLWKVVQSILGWTKNPYRLSRGSYIYMNIYIYVEFLAWNFSDLSHCISKFTRWAILEELSTRRGLRILQISWGRKTHVKHYYVNLSSWYEFRFALIWIDMNVILNLSTAIQQLSKLFRLKWNNAENIFLFKYNDRK